MLKNKKGFTLIELLVVIAIIGLLSTLAVVSLNNARQKSRDAKRVSDVKSVQTALELYYVDQEGYPAATAYLGSSGGNFECLDAAGFSSSGACTIATTMYMGQIPSDPSSGTYYSYISAGTGYTLVFTLEGATGDLAAGLHTAFEGGIR